MSGTLRLTCLFLSLLMVGIGLFPQPTSAQITSALQDQIELLNQASARLDTVRSSLQNERPRAEYEALRAQAQEVAVTATSTVGILTPRLEELQATLTALGDPTEGETALVQSQRADLMRESNELDSAVKQARLLVTSAGETIETLNRAITDLFNRNILERAASPLTPLYWQTLLDNLPVDLSRLTNFFETAGNRFADAMTGSGMLLVAATLAAAVLLLFPIRRSLNQMGQNYAAGRAPRTQLRRTGLAVWFVAVRSLTSSLAIVLIVQGLEWANALAPPASALAWAAAYAAIFSAAAISLGSALLLVGKQSWRLLPISDRAAERLYPFLIAFGCVAVLSAGVIELSRIIGVSPAASVTGNLLAAALHVGLLVAILMTLRRLRTTRGVESEKGAKRQWMVTTAMLLGWIAIAVCMVAMARGYVNLALLISREVFWITFITAGAYLLMAAVDDLATSVFSHQSPAGRALTRGFGLRESTIRQAGLLVSVVTRIAIGLLSVAAVIEPLGGGTGPAYAKISGISLSSIAIGGIIIPIGTIARAGAVFAIGVASVRMISRWMDRTYLPATELDAGARNSASTIIRYLGLALVVTWTVSSLGIGMERLGLVVSALSVGIGFGLQAITQNFISGLILLAERPVKIGDTIRVGTDEGDVKRISVRSTEIQIGDRSTLIIPNSELITKSVRNLTLANPLGRLQIEFSVSIDENADEIAKILLKLFAEHPAVFDDPRPTVYIDSLGDGKINFNSFAFVASPRLAYATRSELLFRLQADLKARDADSGSTKEL